MKTSTDSIESPNCRNRFVSFLAEQFPWLLRDLDKVWAVDALSPALAGIVDFGGEIGAALLSGQKVDWGDIETTPFESGKKRQAGEIERMASGITGFFRREEIRLAITNEEKKWMLRGIILTRAVDATLKRLFLSGEMKYSDASFQGKGFRSLMQEAIYASTLRLRKGSDLFKEGLWTGDIVAPLIRDLGVTLAFTEDDVELAINAQVGKEGRPLGGRDLHIGDPKNGVLFAAAPLAIASATSVGVAFAAKIKQEPRIAVSYIGEGGSSLGEWHESINFAAVKRLPMIFCIQNNQTALSTPVDQQSGVRLFGDKAVGYGLKHLTVDGCDPEEIATSFAWAAELAREGQGPVLIELLSMRMCGHAHHDDMLYLGYDPPFSFDLPQPNGNGYINMQKYKQWAPRDPLKCYAEELIAQGVCTSAEVELMKSNALDLCDRAVQSVKNRNWPQFNGNSSVFFGEQAKATLNVSRPTPSKKEISIEEAPEFSPQGITYLEGVWRGIQEVLQQDRSVYLLGEDVGAPYGNAFMLLRPLLKDYENRIFNTPISENAIIGACVGMALEGLRPIGEMQFNDFVASGFNQLVNNAAKLFYRTGQKVPMVLRMPWGGLRRAGPFHSQDTSPWFYRSFGLKIVVPSTPHDAIGLMMSAVADDNPVLYYEHIGLYRALEVKQRLAEHIRPIEIGKAAFRRLGADLSLISYGAYVHRALQCAERLLIDDGISCDVLDLRSLCPLDMDAIFATVERTGRVLLVGEDSCTGSILESIAAKIGGAAFHHLDAPVKVLGSMDTPVPYSPSLEDEFLLSNETIIQEAKDLCAW